MNILLFNILYSIVLVVLLYTAVYYMACLVDKENKELKYINQKIKNKESVLKGLISLPLTVCIVWILISILTGVFVRDMYKKDKSIAILETRTVDNIRYTVDKYEINNKYMVNSNNVHITYDDKPYIEYVKRIQLGPLYYDTNNGMVDSLNNVELYITEDIANRVKNIKDTNMVYTSNNE